MEKKKYEQRAQFKRRVTRRNGLLNTRIAARSQLMNIAKRNSLESPLLRVPPEIRNMICEYAMGEHHISIHIEERQSSQIKPRSTASALRKNDHPSSTFIYPSFALPKVCRQLYVEVSAMVYTLNTFNFVCPATFDRFIKTRSPGQRRLITSIDIPYKWYRTYRSGLRKHLCRTFPSIARVGVHSKHEDFHYLGGAGALLIADFIGNTEGRVIETDWYVDPTQ